MSDEITQIQERLLTLNAKTDKLFVDMKADLPALERYNRTVRSFNDTQQEVNKLHMALTLALIEARKA